MVSWPMLIIGFGQRPHEMAKIKVACVSDQLATMSVCTFCSIVFLFCDKSQLSHLWSNIKGHVSNNWVHFERCVEVKIDLAANVSS